jgi:hypothetical protein
MKFFVLVVAIIASSNAQFPLFGNVRLPLGGLSRFANQNPNSFVQPSIQLGSLSPVSDFATNILHSISSLGDLTNLLLKNVGLDAVWDSYKVYLF